jgi:hypothetical protein
MKAKLAGNEITGQVINPKSIVRGKLRYKFMDDTLVRKYNSPTQILWLDFHACLLCTSKLSIIFKRYKLKSEGFKH